MMLGLGDGSGSYQLRHWAKGVSDTLTASGLSSFFPLFEFASGSSVLVNV